MFPYSAVRDLGFRLGLTLRYESQPGIRGSKLWATTNVSRSGFRSVRRHHAQSGYSEERCDVGSRRADWVSRDLERGSRRGWSANRRSGCRRPVGDSGFCRCAYALGFGGNRVEEFERRAGGESYQSIAAGGGGILSTVRQTRAASEDELEASARNRLGWAIRNGTTTIEVKSGYGLSLVDETKILKVVRRLNDMIRVVPTFLGAHEIPEEFRANRSGYIDLIINEMLPVVHRGQLAEYVDVFCESHVFSRAETAQIVRAAQALGLPARLHVDQLKDSGGAALAASLGAATADHLECTNRTGIQALKESNVQPVLLPGSVYALGSHRYPLAREMIAAGLPLVLASDFNPGSSPTPSIPMIVSLAVTQCN